MRLPAGSRHTLFGEDGEGVHCSPTVHITTSIKEKQKRKEEVEGGGRRWEGMGGDGRRWDT